MTSQENPKEELEKLSVWLSQMPRNSDGFKTPLFYFDNLQDKVLEKMLEKPVSSRWQWNLGFYTWLQWMLQPRMAWAASMLGILCIGGWYWMKMPIPSLLPQNEEELHAYIQAHIQDFDDELLISYHSENTDFSSDILDELLYDSEKADLD